jgi:hypothetical protein
VRNCVATPFTCACFDQVLRSDVTLLRRAVPRCAVPCCAGVLNAIQVSALFVRLTKLVSSRSLRPRDMLALPSILPQVGSCDLTVTVNVTLTVISDC